jgi:hypothetical protein
MHNRTSRASSYPVPPKPPMQTNQPMAQPAQPPAQANQSQPQQTPPKLMEEIGLASFCCGIAAILMVFGCIDVRYSIYDFGWRPGLQMDDVTGWGLLIGWPLLVMFYFTLIYCAAQTCAFGIGGVILGIVGIWKAVKKNIRKVFPILGICFSIAGSIAAILITQSAFFDAFA